MFDSSCALKIRTYHIRFWDGTSATIRADLRSTAKIVGEGNVRSVQVRAY